MRKYVLQGVSELKGVDITQTELNMCIHYKFGETQDFAT
jgi:hypothetical protein